MKNIMKLAAALILSLPLVMVGCTCSQQENPDQVVPMEDPVATPDDAEGADGLGDGSATEEDGTSVPAEEGMDDGHTPDDGHDH